MALDPEAFQSHQIAHNDPQHLYHVYDNLSQTPYRPGSGIQSGDINVYMMHPQHIITYTAMAAHLDWTNRQPTYFISLYDNLQQARLEANRRRHQIVVPNQTAPRNPATVQIVEISILELERNDVFYFSRNDLLQMLRPPVNNAVFFNSSPGEWFAMAYIPNGAVTRRI